MKNAILKNNF